MGRKPYLRGTDSSFKEKVDYPWIEEFFLLLRPSDIKIGSMTLHQAYVAWVRARAPHNVGAITIALRSKGFCSQLKAYLEDIYDLKQDDKNKFRGYYVELVRLSRHQSNPPPTVPEVIEPVVEYDPNLVYEKGYLKIMKVNAECGYSAFARTDIPAGAFVVEYLGKRVTLEKGAELNQHYVEDLDLPSTMLDMYESGKKYAIDGHKRDSGDRFKIFENPAAYINSQEDINLRMKVVNHRAELYAMFDIPKNMELFWDYNCPKNERPDFCKKRRYKPLD